MLCHFDIQIRQHGVMFFWQKEPNPLQLKEYAVYAGQWVYAHNLMMQMVSFPFREKRITSNIPVWLKLQANTNQVLHPGRIEATIINVSKTGACLLTPKLLIEGKHLFFTTLNSSHSLLLQSHESMDTLEDFALTARSVWMDSCQHMNQHFFKVGICFSTPQNHFFTTIQKHLRNP